jgi:hypothetical protein
VSNFFQRLKTAWHFWKLYPPIVLPPGYWTNENARALSNFKVSDTGIKLSHIWIARLHSAEREAMRDDGPTKYKNGVAWGIRMMIEESDQLLAISQPTGEQVVTEGQLESAFRSVNR